jgi:hypothetical protein
LNDEKFHAFLNEWYLVQVACVTAVGSATVPHFALGLAVGAAHWIVARLSVCFLRSVIGYEFTEASQRYKEGLRTQRHMVALYGPIKEEIFFRGFMQQIFLFTVFNAYAPHLYLLPFFSTGMSVAVASSILITSVMFGLIHLGSSENGNNYEHAILTTIGGMIYGVLAAQFAPPGDMCLLVPIAAHIANNTLALLYRSLNEENKPAAEDDASLRTSPG